MLYTFTHRQDGRKVEHMKTAAFFGALCVSFVVGAASVSAVSNNYLKIGDIKGESATQAESGGMSAQTETSASASVKGSAENTARENACEAGCRDQYGGSGSAGFDACIRGCGAAGPATPAREVQTSEQLETSVGPLRKELDKASPQLMQVSAEGTGGNEGNAEIAQHNQSDLEFLVRGASVRAVEVRGWDPKQKEEFLTTVKTHAQLRSGQDLENFAEGVLVKDEGIENISFNYQKIEFEYKAQGRLFGFIPLNYAQSVTVNTRVEGGGRVKVKFPWYSILMKTGASTQELETDIAASLESSGDLVGLNPQPEPPSAERKSGSIIAADFNYRAEASAYARAFTTISNVLKTKHDAAMASIQNTR